MAYIGVGACAVLASAGCDDLQRTSLSNTTQANQPVLADSFVRSLIKLERTIVEIESSDSFTLGGVSSATLRPSDSTLFVVDHRLNTISAFSIGGQRLFTVGRLGSGPGEFREPRLLTIRADGDLELFDAALRRITRYTLDLSNARVDTTITIRAAGNSMCSIDSHYFTFGLVDATIVEEFDEGGQQVQSFGRPFGGADAMLQHAHSFGVIACAPIQHLVVVVPHNLPMMRAYSSRSGALAWEAALHGYEPILVRRLPRRDAIEYAFGERGRGHYALSAIVLSPTVIAIQYGLISTDSHGPSDLRGIATEFVDLANGHLLGKTTTLPWMIYAAPPLLVTATDDPYPKITVAQFRFIETNR